MRKSLPQAVPKSMLSRECGVINIVALNPWMFELLLTAVVVVDTGLGKHSIVLQFRLAKRRAVTGNDDQLGYLEQKHALVNRWGTISALKKREKGRLLVIWELGSCPPVE